MKHTEKRWMDKRGDVYRGAYDPDAEDIAKNGLKRVTVTWDEPEYEDVEVVRYLCIDEPTGLVSTNITDYPQPPARNEIAVELRGTYRRRKPEPEVWEGTTKRSVQGDVAMIQLSPSWIGKKVRVEVVK